jgi:predicted deacetylase
MNIKKWQEMESLLDRHGIRPIVGVIPHNLDPSLVNKFEYNQKFWDLVINWEAKGWTVAMHGYNHVYETTSGG